VAFAYATRHSVVYNTAAVATRCGCMGTLLLALMEMMGPGKGAAPQRCAHRMHLDCGQGKGSGQSALP
jgi:hypothetical protein